MSRAARLGSFAAALFAVSAALAREPAPYRLVLETAFGHPPGPEVLRREIEVAALAALDRARCFAAVTEQAADGSAAGDLVLRITLDGFEDRLDNESSIAERTSPRANPAEQATRVVARSVANVRLELGTLPDRLSVRLRKMHKEAAYRPVLYEDARREAQMRFVEQVVHELQSFACKADPAKLEKEIARARAAVR